LNSISDENLLTQSGHKSNIVHARGARFFLTKIPEFRKIYQITTTLPKGHKIYQMAIKYTKFNKIYQHFPF
jgi:hypothetical protein